ncbi:helix-turn-helix transcriptional regulator [Myxacorys almedinensis]|uniref:WYL domain-containing protein n=1 Tax=Myxacorys almedinensis A TaxID=2690445 RepID=A0A8J7Z6G4_9CYAN|nr:WYL domain-containing protein [Myxacorys almedinensis]NDJ19036.1 WYL domain-containing protein [Myxacorys almedinensis A]
MGRKGESITLSISDRDKAQLESLALELGMTWGDRANISKLVEAIARRQLIIAPNHDWTAERIRSLNHARTALLDAGQIQDALAIAQILVSRSEISIPMRIELEQFIQHPSPPWRLEVERYIQRQQPFQLSYQDAAERVWQFTIRCAEVAVHEERHYLDCWCEETEDSRDLPELRHNRCLRFDRIADAAIAPVSGQWHSSLATIRVEMHLFRGLAFAYRSKTSHDEVNEWLTDLPQVRRVVRRVSNTFWFIREVLRYGQDCEVVFPEGVRDRVKQELQGLCRQYGLLEGE